MAAFTCFFIYKTKHVEVHVRKHVFLNTYSVLQVGEPSNLVTTFENSF